MRTRAWMGVGLGAAVLGVLLRPRFKLKHKVVVITGGARGLGFLLAREVLRRGGKVAICSRDEAEVARARRALSRRGTVFAEACDVTDRAQLHDFLGRVTQELGVIDVLVNNAGVIQVGPMEEMTTHDYEAAMLAHFWAPLYATLEVLPQMRRSHAGHIVNITSIGAKVAVPHLLPYSASKFAMYGLSAGLRTELAKDSVVVTTVCPGLMRTGSARHAAIKGKVDLEYAWFNTASKLPGLSMSAKRAARQILDASARGDAELVLSLPAKVLARLHAFAPGFVQNVLGVVNRVLPGPERRRLEGGEAAHPYVMPAGPETDARAGVD